MTNRANQIRSQIRSLVQEYYQEQFAHRPPFVPGESRVEYGGRTFDDAELCYAVDASLDFWLTYGRFSKEFENKLAQFLGVRWAFLVNSGSSANLLAFAALTSHLLGDRRVLHGDEVITVAAGFPTTIAPIIQLGAIPVFVDIDQATTNIDVRLLEQALSPRTKAVMLAHTLGNPFDIGAVKSFCDRHGLWLVEDNCDALGSTYQGKPTGTWGDIGTSSFYPPHHMTMGEGGAVYTSNPTLKRILLSLRDWGRDCYCESGVDNTCARRFQGQHGTLPFGYDHKYVYSHLGFNLKATDWQAAIGVAQLEKIPAFCEQRRHNHNLLAHLLRSAPYLQLPVATADSDPSWFGFLLKVDENAPFSRNDLTHYLEEQKIQTRTLFAGNIVRQPIFTNLQEGRDYRICGELRYTDQIMNQGFWIGVYPGLEEDRLRYMATCILEFVDQYPRRENHEREN